MKNSDVKEGHAIQQISAARRALAEVSTLHDALDLRDKMAALKVYADAIGMGEIAQQAKEAQLRAERLAGEFLRDMPKAVGGRPVETPDATSGVSSELTLDDMGISYKQSSRWQKIASIPEERFEAAIERAYEDSQELTQSALLKMATGPHVSHNSGENEWYTPTKYIEAARRVLGSIDLDPASSDVANVSVRASHYYTAEDDGLTKEWNGATWMNPPYSQPLISQFCIKWMKEYDAGNITSGIVLVNNATETGWFQTLLSRSSSVCLPKGRVKFIDAAGNPSGAPLQGQAVLYFGENCDTFAREFSGFGKVLYV